MPSPAASRGAASRATATALGRASALTRPSNLAAIALYARHGFRRIALRRGYYPAEHGREDALVYSLAL